MGDGGGWCIALGMYLRLGTRSRFDSSTSSFLASVLDFCSSGALLIPASSVPLFTRRKQFS